MLCLLCYVMLCYVIAHFFAANARVTLLQQQSETVLAQQIENKNETL
jgi:hypothetical protein